MSIIKKIIVLSLVVLMVMSISSLFVNAANISDWDWNKSVGVGSTCVTGHREKQDDSSAYIYYEAGTKNPVQVRVYGTNNSTTLAGVDDGTNYTLRNAYNNYNTYYDVYTGTERGLQNIVYETGLDYAYLKISVGTGYLAYGLWSPDSVGDYT